MIWYDCHLRYVGRIWLFISIAHLGVVCGESRSKSKKGFEQDICFKRLDYVLKILAILDSKFNTIGGHGNLFSKINTCALSIIVTNQGKSNPQNFKLCWCFTIALFMQRNFHCMNLIGRSLRKWKTRLSTPAYLMCKGSKIRGSHVQA